MGTVLLKWFYDGVDYAWVAKMEGELINLGFTAERVYREVNQATYKIIKGPNVLIIAYDRYDDPWYVEAYMVTDLASAVDMTILKTMVKYLGEPDSVEPVRG